MRHTSASLLVAATAAAVALTASAQTNGAPTPTPPPTPLPVSPAERTADRVVEAVWQWNLTKAKNILENRQDKDGDAPEYKAARGFVVAAEGKPQDGLAQLSGEVKAAGAAAAIPFLHGEVLYWQKKYGEADAAWRTAYQRAKDAVQQAPTDARAQFYLGAAAAKLKKYDEAKRALQRAAELGFDPTLVAYQRGVNAFLAEKWSEAEDAFTAALEEDDRFAYAYFYRGLVWSKLGRKDNMLLDLDTFVKLASSSPDVGTARAILSAYGG